MARRLIRKTLVVFNPDCAKSSSDSRMTSSNPVTACRSCDETMQTSQSSNGPGALHRSTTGRSLPNPRSDCGKRRSAIWPGRLMRSARADQFRNSLVHLRLRARASLTEAIGRTMIDPARGFPHALRVPAGNLHSVVPLTASVPAAFVRGGQFLQSRPYF